MAQRSGSSSRNSQSIPVIKVTRSQSNTNGPSTRTKNNNNTTSFFSRFNRNQDTNFAPKSKASNGRPNLRNKSVTPIDHQNYFSSTQKLGPSRQSWQALSQVVHDLASRCFVGTTNPQLLTEFLHAESQLSDFFRLSKMVFNNARPTRANPRRFSQTSHQPKPPNENKRSSSARRKIRSSSNASSNGTEKVNNSEKEDELNSKKNSETSEKVDDSNLNKTVGSDLRPTHALSKMGLQFIEQWDSFLGEFNIVSLNGVSPLNSLISSRLLFISQFMKKTVSSFFVAPQANVPIGAMNHAYSVSLSIARKAKRLHTHSSDFARGIIQLENSIIVFFSRVVPHPMAYTNAIQCARKDLLIQLTEVKQMVYGISIFDSVIESVRLLMEDVNNKFNALFTDLNLPYRIVASYEDEDENNTKAVGNVNNNNNDDDFVEEEEEAVSDEADEIKDDFDDFDYQKKLQDKETVEHLDKIRSNIEKIEEALALGQKMIKKKK